MARTTVLTKDQIVQCAFDIARDKGINAITIREIGNRLGKSTAPIYSQYDSMDSILADLITHINGVILKYTMLSSTQSGFLNIGRGFITFVMENKRIFTDFFLSIDGTSSIFSSDGDFYIQEMRKDPLLNFLSDESLSHIYNDMIIYTYGLATMICSNLGPGDDLNYYLEKLEKAGNSMIGYHILSSGLYGDVIKNLIIKKG